MINGRLLIKGGYSGPTDARYILFVGSDDNKIYLSSDAGASFTYIGITAYSAVNVRACISGNGQYIWIVGYSGSAHYIYGSTDYGATWGNSSWGYTYLFKGIGMSNSGQYVYATVPNSQYVYVSTNYGGWFSAINTGVSRGHYDHITVNDSGSTAIATCTSDQYPLLTTNYGSSWGDITTVHTAYQGRAGLSASGQYGLIVYSSGASLSPYRSSDSLSTWTAISSPKTTLAHRAFISHTGQYQSWSEGSTVYLSTNWGNNWSTVYPLPDYNGMSYIVHSVDEVTRFAANFLNGSYFMYKSTNSGSSWTEIPMGQPYRLLAINKYLD